MWSYARSACLDLITVFPVVSNWWAWEESNLQCLLEESWFTVNRHTTNSSLMPIRTQRQPCNNRFIVFFTYSLSFGGLLLSAQTARLSSPNGATGGTWTHIKVFCRDYPSQFGFTVAYDYLYLAAPAGVEPALHWLKINSPRPLEDDAINTKMVGMVRIELTWPTPQT